MVAHLNVTRAGVVYLVGGAPAPQEGHHEERSDLRLYVRLL